VIRQRAMQACKILLPAPRRVRHTIEGEVAWAGRAWASSDILSLDPPQPEGEDAVGEALADPGRAVETEDEGAGMKEVERLRRCATDAGREVITHSGGD